MAKGMEFAKGSAALLLMMSFIVAIIVPLPSIIIDFSLVFAVAISITIYMRSLTIKEWNELKTFPTILLITTIFRIALNISTTRKILHDGDPGHVIEQFGNFVVGSNIWVGIVVFLILIVVQFIIANGASRTSEVAARFTLDSLPGKQMSIDSDLSQGLIGEQEAKDKRKNLDMEIDFYGNMDGAGKFIKGDVIAGVVLVVINIVFGLIIGMAVQGMTLADAAYKFTLLTIGDGLVNQISSFLIAVSSGIVMTRVYDGSDQNLTQSVFKELTANPMVIIVVGGMFLSMGALTPLPFLPFAVVAALLFYIGYKNMKKTKEEGEEKQKREQQEAEENDRKERNKVEVQTEVEAISLEVGIQLIPVVANEKEGETLKDKIIMIRKNIAKELGVAIPFVHVVDNSSLFPYTKYQIKIKDSVVAEGELRVNHLLAFKTPYVVRQIEGQVTKDPIFGEEAIWIADAKVAEAREMGYQVLDPLSILSTHLNEMIRRHVHELMERQEVQNLLDKIASSRKVLIDEIKNENISLSMIQKVLQGLLAEYISIRDLPTILESIIDGSKLNGTAADDITGYVREKLSKQICDKNKNPDGKIYVLLLDFESQKKLETFSRYGDYYLLLNATEERKLMESIMEESQRAQMADIEPVILIDRHDLRFALSRLIRKYNTVLPVMSTNELVTGVMIEQVGTIKLNNE